MSIHQNLRDLRTARNLTQEQVAAQKQVNADLADAVENSGDPARQSDIARDKLGLVEPGEYVFYFTD